MKAFKFIVFTVILLSVSSIHAQFLKNLKKKIADKINTKIEHKVDTEIDKEVDKAIEYPTRKKPTASSNSTSQLPKVLKFNQSVHIQVSNGKNDPVEFKMLFGDYQDIYAILLDEKHTGGSGVAYNVISPNSITMFMDMPGMRIKKSVNQEQLSDYDYTSKIPDEDDLIKTGRTKNILGYTCYEYKYTNEDGVLFAWVSKKTPLNGKMIPMLGMKKDGPFKGAVLEFDFTYKKENSNIKVLKIQSQNTQINTNTYNAF